jgi:hypothetical protein
MKITVIQKENLRRAYLVNLKDWMNSDKFVVNAQVPYIGIKEVISKDNYAIVGVFHESGDHQYFAKGGE